MPLGAQARRAVRTQEERTAATRTRLTRAALELLVERGYWGLTAVEVAARAGVTRGALNHHFHSTDALVVHSVSHLLKETTAEIRSFAGLVQNGSLTPSGFLDKLWEIFSGPFFLVTLEQVTASRHNDVLRT